MHNTQFARLIEKERPDWSEFELDKLSIFEGLEGIIGGHGSKVLHVRGKKLHAADLEMLNEDLGQFAPAQVSGVTGPYRAVDGDWLLAIILARHSDIEVDSKVSQPSTWLGVLVDLDQVLEASQLGQLVTAGFDYELSRSGSRGGKKGVIARSTEGELRSSFTERIDLPNHQWTLVASRREEEGAWDTGATKGLIICFLTLLCSLTTYDFTGRLERLQAKLDQRNARLRDASRRLMAETHKRIEATKEFTHASFHDPVSGIPNRRYFLGRLEQSLLELRREGNSSLAVLIVSFDGFRRVSDGLGHSAADELLIRAARRIEASLQPANVEIARLTDGDLAVLLSNLSSSEAALSAAEHLRETFTQPFGIEDQAVLITATIGLTVRSSGFEKPEELVREADVSVSMAKSQGRSRVVAFDRQASEEMAILRQLEMGLPKAVEREEFRLFFQPIVSLATGRIAGMETLIRWQHPLEGVIGPDKFIRLAEELEIIGPITRWVIRKACVQAREWVAVLPSGTDFYLSVNLSGHDMMQPSLCDYIDDVRKDNQIPNGMLRLEVTEGAMIENFRAASALAKRLRNKGVPFLLDDFGTGYSSLSYLHRLHVDYLKIDRSFVSDLTPTSDRSAIVKAIVQLAEGFGISTIAEGIETLDNLVQLREFGCHYGQGYYFSRPVSAERAGEMLASRQTWHVGSRPRVAQAGA